MLRDCLCITVSLCKVQDCLYIALTYDQCMMLLLNSALENLLQSVPLIDEHL